jgi:phosphoribosylamine-glycine ligase
MDLQAFEQQQQSLVQKLSQEIKTREEALVEKEKQFGKNCSIQYHVPEAYYRNAKENKQNQFEDW